MNLEKKKFILDCIMAGFVIISLIIAVRGCILSEKTEKIAKTAIEISKEANKISNDALEITQHQFLQINKPYITLKLKKFNDGLNLSVKAEDTKVMVALEFELKNSGNVIAKDINFSAKGALALEGEKEESVDVILEKLGEISLAPGENRVMGLSLPIESKDKDKVKQDFDWWNSDEREVIISFSVNYTNGVDETSKYQTSIKQRVSKKHSSLLQYEMIDLLSK